MPAITTTIRFGIGGISQHNKEKERHKNWKGNGQIIPVCLCCDGKFYK